MENIQKFGSIEAFWQLVRKYTGYIEEEDKPLDLLAAHVLFTALSQTRNGFVLKGLERFVSETNQAYCYSLVHEWRSYAQKEKQERLFEICRFVEEKWQLSARFDRFEPEMLLSGDIFPCINESILKQLYREITDHVVRCDLIMKVSAKTDVLLVGMSIFQNILTAFSLLGKCSYFIRNMQVVFMW